MSDNMTQLLIVILPPLITGIINIIIEYIRTLKPSEPPIDENPPVASTNAGRTKKPQQKVAKKDSRSIDWKHLQKPLIIQIFIALILGFIGAKIWYVWTHPSEKLLWGFDQNTQAWQPEKLSTAKPESAATGVSWNSSGAALKGEFDFLQVKPEIFFDNDIEPRATYYIDPVNDRDWSAFQTLTFDVENQSAHDLKVTFSISNGTCWYEFGQYQSLPQGQKSVLRFNLKEQLYKTCKASGSKDNPPVTFNKVWRFDIIVGTPEKPWKQVKGSILIDNIKLTDRIMP